MGLLGGRGRDQLSAGSRAGMAQRKGQRTEFPRAHVYNVERKNSGEGRGEEDAERDALLLLDGCRVGHLRRLAEHDSEVDDGQLLGQGDDAVDEEQKGQQASSAQTAHTGLTHTAME